MKKIKFRTKAEVTIIAMLLIAIIMNSVLSGTVTITDTTMTTTDSSLEVNYEDGWIRMDNATVDNNSVTNAVINTWFADDWFNDSDSQGFTWTMADDWNSSNPNDDYFNASDSVDMDDRWWLGWNSSNVTRIRNSNGNSYAVTETGLQAAIDDLTSGGTVWLPSGTITGGQITSTANDLHIKGSGFSTKYVLDDGTDDHPFYFTGNNITVSDLKIDGNVANNPGEVYGVYTTGKNAVINAVMSINCNDLGIRTDGDGSVISNCIAINNTRDGIAVDRGSGFSIVNNYCSGNGDSGIGMGLGSSHITITGNVIYADESSHLKGGIYIGSDTHHITIVGNTIENNNTGDYGIGFTQSGGSGVNHVLISDNIINNSVSTGYGIYIQGGSFNYNNIKISNNMISNCGGISGYGVRISASNAGYVVTNITISDNTISDSFKGVFIASDTDKLMICGNNIHNITSNGIDLWQGQQGGSISNNVVSNCGDIGIGCATDYFLISGNSIINCNQDNNGNYKGSAIWLGAGSTNNIVSNNFINSNRYAKNGIHHKYGIYESDATADYNVIVGNALYNITTTFIYKMGGNSTVKDNIGYTTESNGLCTIASGDNSVTVSHNMSTTPSIVLFGSRDNLTAAGVTGNPYVDTFTATQFTLHVDAQVTADVSFWWKAEYN